MPAPFSLNAFSPLPPEIHIGELDAWSEEQFIRNHFVKTHQFKQLTMRNYTLVFGRRGTGKSAIAVCSDMLQHWHHHYPIKGERTSYGTYLDLAENLAKRQDDGFALNLKAFVELEWTYFIHIVILLAVTKTLRARNAAEQQQFNEIQEYLVDLKVYPDVTIGYVLCTLHQEALSHLTSSARDSTPAIQHWHLLINGTALRRCISYLPDITRDRSLLVVFDSIESFDIYKPYVKDTLRGIVSAICAMSQKPQMQDVGLRLLVPAEIYEELTDDAPAKRASQSIILQWRIRDLFLLLAVRYYTMLANTSLSKMVDPSHWDVIGDLVRTPTGTRSADYIRRMFWYHSRFLPPEITNRHGTREDCLAYIIRHTQRRPRDLILIFNAIIDHAFQRSELPFLSEQSVKDGVHSKDTLNNLVTNMIAVYNKFSPELPDRVRTAFTQKPRIMTGLELKQFALESWQLMAEPSESADQAETTRDFVNLLLRSGVIGRVVNPNRRCWSPYNYCVAEFEYLIKDRIAYNDEFIYCVHPAFGDWLKMGAVDGYGVVYPIPVDDLELEKDLRLEEIGGNSK